MKEKDIIFHLKEDFQLNLCGAGKVYELETLPEPAKVEITNISDLEQFVSSNENHCRPQRLRLCLPHR